jgi:hypothetical protein
MRMRGWTRMRITIRIARRRTKDETPCSEEQRVPVASLASATVSVSP